jgi:vacuolar protein sorting-associated protein IST1
MDFLFPYNETKIKPYLKMAVQRIQVHKNKKATAVKIQKKEVATILAEGKDEKAKIRAEHIIREDFTIEGLELLELNLELIHERIKQITTSKECPPDMKEAVSSVIWAANYVDVPELKDISSQLTKKFGSKFAEAAQKNENNEVNIRLSQKLTYKPPSKLLVRNYLEAIAKVYDVEWKPREEGLFIHT